MSGYIVPDPGLQVERTGLAWVRSSAAVGVVGLLLLRWLPVHGLLVAVPSIAAFAVAAWLRITARRHYRWGLGVTRPEPDDAERRRRDAVHLHATAHPGRVLSLLTAVVALAAVGVWVMLAAPTP